MQTWEGRKKWDPVSQPQATPPKRRGRLWGRVGGDQPTGTSQRTTGRQGGVSLPHLKGKQVRWFRRIPAITGGKALQKDVYVCVHTHSDILAYRALGWGREGQALVFF